MATGRTHPILVGAEDPSNKAYEVVVKLRSKELGFQSQIAELVSAQLAFALRISVPQAAVVDIPLGFESVVSPEYSLMFKNSLGKNFGTIHLGAGFTTWATGKAPQGGQRDRAAEIFAFDLLIQNPDRRTVNPNVWSRSEQIGVYDHEQAFSFLSLPILGGVKNPWDAIHHPQIFDFMQDHLFYSVLRGGRLELDRFEENLVSLSKEQVISFTDSVPGEWRKGNNLCEKIEAYLIEAAKNANQFTNFVRHILR